MLTVDRIRSGLSAESRCVRWACGMRGEYWVTWRRVRSVIRSRLFASKKPKSPVWMIAAAFS